MWLGTEAEMLHKSALLHQHCTDPRPLPVRPYQEAESSEGLLNSSSYGVIKKLAAAHQGASWKQHALACSRMLRECSFICQRGEEHAPSGACFLALPQAGGGGTRCPGGARKQHPGGAGKRRPRGTRNLHPGGAVKRHPGGAVKQYPVGAKKRYPGGGGKQHPAPARGGWPEW